MNANSFNNPTNLTNPTNPTNTPKIPKNLSPLFDPIILHSDVAETNKITNFIMNIDWKKLLILYILPILIIFFILFYLKERYNKKQEFENEFGIVDVNEIYDEDD